MNTALLLYPHESVVKLLKVILQRKGYTINSMEADKGLIKAETKSGIFKKSSTLEIRATKVDQHTTHLDIWINGNQSVYDKPRTTDESMETEMIDTIYKYF